MVHNSRNGKKHLMEREWCMSVSKISWEAFTSRNSSPTRNFPSKFVIWAGKCSSQPIFTVVHDEHLGKACVRRKTSLGLFLSTFVWLREDSRTRANDLQRLASSSSVSVHPNEIADVARCLWGASVPSFPVRI